MRTVKLVIPHGRITCFTTRMGYTDQEVTLVREHIQWEPSLVSVRTASGELLRVPREYIEESD